MKIKIMAVDDEPDVLELLKTMLETRGYEVLAIEDSREALKRLEVEKVDGLFVDVRMPYFDGFELTKLVRASKLNGKVPIVMLTASDDGETMRKGFDMGISFFLGKPFTRERVYNLLGVTKGPMTQEHLRYIRVPFQTSVSCNWGYNSVGHLKTDSRDISEGGMRLSPLGDVEVGQEVGLVFALPDTRRLHLNAQVVRKVPDDGIGLKFVTLPAEDKAAIQQYIHARIED
ncbi:MAG: response regulator [Terriglobia bacterium]